MKKFIILTALLFGLTLCICLPRSYASAEIDGVTITLSRVTSSYSSLGKFDGQSNTFSIDYSQMPTNFFLSITASANLSDGSISYKWTNSEGRVLSEYATLSLYKSPASTEDGANALVVGRSVYTLTASRTVGNETATDQKKLTVDVTDTQNAVAVSQIITNSPIPVSINISSESIDFYNFLPIANSYTTQWLLKTPNHDDFNIMLTVTDKKPYTFTPADVINAENGYGEYVIMTKSVDSKRNVYYSNEVRLNITPNKFLGKEGYSILQSKVKNTRASVEAFEFTVDNQETINPENLYWYVNNVKTCSGFKLTYEPLTTESFRVTVKYRYEGSLTELATITTKPSATGTGVLIGAIVGGVVLLSAILAFTIIIQNKKRDVVW